MSIETGQRPVDKTVLDHADRISQHLAQLAGETEDRVTAIMSAVFDDAQIKKEFAGSPIREISMVAEVIRELLRRNELPVDLLTHMAIGDVELPRLQKEIMSEVLHAAAQEHARLFNEEGTGYDLAAKGSYRSREALVALFDKHYGFSGHDGLSEHLANNMCITAGGMRALGDIAVAMNLRALKQSRRNRFIYPDASFSTWKTIVTAASHGGLAGEVHELPTKQKDSLHLTADEVYKFYRENPVNTNERSFHDTWCITPVGNPSGTVISSEQLAGVCNAILINNPQAVIIFDCAYVRLLQQQQARALMKIIFDNPQLRRQSVFIDSFSKTHGLCRERMGACFSDSDEIFGDIQNWIMVTSAGNGQWRSALALALADMAPYQNRDILELHNFWARERAGLYYYLRQPKFAHLFNDDQSHIDEEQLRQPMTIYLLMKLRSGITMQQVALATGCIGVETSLASGHYIRFAIGRITEPTYSQHTP